MHARDDTRRFAEGLRRHAPLAAVWLLLALVLWESFRYVAQVALLVFGGGLLSIVLTVPAEWLERRFVHLSRSFALALVVLVFVALLLGVFVLFGVELASQMDQIVRGMRRASTQVQETLQQTGWGRWLTRIPVQGQGSPAWSGGFTWMSSGVYALVSFVFIFFTGLYLASQPALYREGLVQLLPPRSRDRTRQVMNAVGGTLRWWILGQLVSMAVVGVLTTIGLSLLGAPFPIGLGLIAAVLTFVPNVGPTIALVPAVLLSFLEGPTTALSVAAMYVAVQTVESYAITPLVQQRTVYLPPALTIASQFLLWLLAGTLGLFVATPLTAAGLVLVRMLYLNDVLHDEATPDR